MSKKEFLELQAKVLRRWQEIMGKPVTVQAHAPRRYPIKQWEKDRKRLEDEG